MGKILTKIRFSQDFKSGITEIQLLKSNWSAEIKKREALEVNCLSLKHGYSFLILSTCFHCLFIAYFCQFELLVDL